MSQQDPWKSSDVSDKTSLVHHADRRKLREIFEKYATNTCPETNEPYLTYREFVVSYLGLNVDDYEPPATADDDDDDDDDDDVSANVSANNVNQPEDGNSWGSSAVDRDKNNFKLKALGSVADSSRSGRISFEDFQEFESMLCRPDAVFALAFRIFDTDGSGYVTYAEFERIIKQTTYYWAHPFNFAGDFITMHFGKKRQRHMSYDEFCQFIYDYHEEYAVQAFRRYDRHSKGYIRPLEFYEIMLSLKQHLLTDTIRDHLVELTSGEPGFSVSFPYFSAVISLLGNMELVKQIYLSATAGNRTMPLLKEQFLFEAQMYSNITPLEVDILFKIVGLLEEVPGASIMNYAALEAISPTELRKPFQFAKTLQEKVQEVGAAVTPRPVLMQVFESLYRFGLGAIAGAVGATIVYPIDLVKTRMQNQRAAQGMVGELMYKNSVDCFQKVFRYEGFRGLYRGLGPQLVGVAPEKAIKLTVNDFVRDKFYQRDGSIHLAAECFAGGCAGGSQVMFTNPLEIVKIRLQVAGEITTGGRPNAAKVLKELGFFARICRSSPQFGFTLLTYELLQRIFYIDFGSRRKPVAEEHIRQQQVIPSNPDLIGGYRLAGAAFAAIQSRFGLAFGPSHSNNWATVSARSVNDVPQVALANKALGNKA